MRIREHDVTLRGDKVVLRPMTEDDWDLLLRYCYDLVLARESTAEQGTPRCQQ